VRRWLLLGWKGFFISLRVTLQWVAWPLAAATLFDLPSFFRRSPGGVFLPHLHTAMPFLQLTWLALGCGLSVALLAYTSEKAPGPRVWAALPFYAAVFSEFLWVPALIPRFPGPLPWPTAPERAAGVAACAACAVVGKAIGMAARHDRASRPARLLERCRSVKYRAGWKDKRLEL